MQIGALWQEMYRSQYFEGGRVLHGGDLRHRHRPARHQGQGAGRAGLPAARRQAARPHPHLRLDRRRGRGRRCHRASPRSCWSAGLARRSGFVPRRTEQQGRSSSRASRSARPQAWLDKAREALGDDVGPRHRLPPPAVGRRGGVASASRCRRGTLDFLEEPIRDETPEAYESLRTMTDVPFAIGEEFASEVAVPALHRARHPPVRPASTSAMSAG